MKNTTSMPIDQNAIIGGLQVPTATDNKYTRGVPLIATGSPTYPGAAVLTVLGARAVGVGMVRYLGQTRCEDLILKVAPEVVMGGGRFQTALVGSGWDSSMATFAERLARECAEAQLPLVVDAGALRAVREWARDNPRIIATPHPGEAERMFDDLGERFSRAEIEGDLEAAARRLSTLSGATIVLKGASTVIAAPGAELHVFEAPCAWGATAGAGDVLAGAIAGMVAGAVARGELAPARPDPCQQPPLDDVDFFRRAPGSGGDRGRAPAHPSQSFLSAVAAAVGLHGLACARASGVLAEDLDPTGTVGHPIVAEDIARTIPEVFGEILAKGAPACTS